MYRASKQVEMFLAVTREELLSNRSHDPTTFISIDDFGKSTPRHTNRSEKCALGIISNKNQTVAGLLRANISRRAVGTSRSQRLWVSQYNGQPGRGCFDDVIGLPAFQLVFVEDITVSGCDGAHTGGTSGGNVAFMVAQIPA